MVNSSYNEIEIEIEVYKEKKKEERSLKNGFKKRKLIFFQMKQVDALTPPPIAATARPSISWTVLLV